MAINPKKLLELKSPVERFYKARHLKFPQFISAVQQAGISRRNRDRDSDHHTRWQNFHFQPEGTAGRHRSCEKSTELPVNI